MKSSRVAGIAACLLGIAAGLLVPRTLAAQAPPALLFARPTLAPSVKALASPEKDAIVAAIEGFLRSEDFFDATALDAVLHPDARGWSETDGEAEHEGWTEYVTWLRSDRKKPAPRDHSKDVRRITDLAQYGHLAQAVLYNQPVTASGAESKTYFGLQLLKSNGRWTIVSLTYYSDRLEGQTDDRTLDAMGVSAGMTIGEVGAGSGRFTVPLSRRVGPSGKVYANDIDEKALAQLKTRMQRLGVSNVEAVLGKVDDPLFPKGALDMVVMVWVFHHLDQPVALLRSLVPSLKPGATVVILDPAAERGGGRDSDRPSTAASVAKEAAEAGFELVRTETFLPKDDIFILRPRASARMAGRPRRPNYGAMMRSLGKKVR